METKHYKLHSHYPPPQPQAPPQPQMPPQHPRQQTPIAQARPQLQQVQPKPGVASATTVVSAGGQRNVSHLVQVRTPQGLKLYRLASPIQTSSPTASGGIVLNRSVAVQGVQQQQHVNIAPSNQSQSQIRTNLPQTSNSAAESDSVIGMNKLAFPKSP